MSRKRLDWDRAKWDAFRAKASPPSTSEEIDSTEEAELRAWWDAKKPPPLHPPQQLPKKKKHRLKHADRVAKAKAKADRKKGHATHAERLAKWKAGRILNPRGGPKEK